MRTMYGRMFAYVVPIIICKAWTPGKYEIIHTVMENTVHNAVDYGEVHFCLINNSRTAKVRIIKLRTKKILPIDTDVVTIDKT